MGLQGIIYINFINKKYILLLSSIFERDAYVT